MAWPAEAARGVQGIALRGPAVGQQEHGRGILKRGLPQGRGQVSLVRAV